jgi:Ca2+-binding EF-hand superfamily protein
LIKTCNIFFPGKASVTFPEFLKMFAEQKAKHINIEREILNAFALQDRSRRGYITRAEFEHLLVRGGEQMTKQEGLYMVLSDDQSFCIQLG